MWSTSKDLRTGYVTKAERTEKFLQNKKASVQVVHNLKIKNQIMA